MATTFKITAVSPKTKSWEGSYGPMLDYYVKLEGQDAPVVITKKPSSAPPQAGQELYGTLDMSGKFGPKFKAERQEFGGGGGGFSGGSSGSKPAYQPKNEESIHAQFAIREANLQVVNGLIQPEELEAKAKDFFAMIDRVKGGEATEEKKEADGKPSMDELDDIFGPSDVIPAEEVPFP